MNSDFVPGTIRLVDVDHRKDHEGGPYIGNDAIELVPTPSSDPEDPLNWTRKRKMINLISLNVYIFCVAIATTLHYSVLADITRDAGIPTSDLVQGNGVMFLLLGWSCLFWQPIALTYGRRGVYLLSIIMTIPLMVWTGYATSTGAWYGRCALIGFAVAPVEALPEVSIPDVFFAHERGRWIGLYVFNVFGSNFLAPIIAGWFAQAFGWRWTMWFGAILCAAGTIFCYFTLEETLYFRDTIEGELQAIEPQDTPASSKVKTSLNEPPEKGVSEDVTESASPPLAPEPLPPRTYRQKLSFFVNMPNRPTNMQMLHGMYLPLFFIVQFPTVLWSGFIYGINLCWYNVIVGTASPVLANAPYNWSSGAVGSIYVGPFIGAALSSYFAGRIADSLALRLARRNHGIREPEQRLWCVAVSAVLTSAGLILWGIGADREIHWVGLAFGLGMVACGVVVGGVIGLSYNVDCFKDISGGTTTSVIVIRNTLSFAISYGITPWWENMGLQNCFISVCFIALASNATFLLMIWKGKTFRRSGTQRYFKYAQFSMARH